MNHGIHYSGIHILFLYFNKYFESQFFEKSYAIQNSVIHLHQLVFEKNFDSENSNTGRI